MIRSEGTRKITSIEVPRCGKEREMKKTFEVEQLSSGVCWRKNASDESGNKKEMFYGCFYLPFMVQEAENKKGVP